MTPIQIRKLFRASALAFGLPLVSAATIAHAAEPALATAPEATVSFTQLDANQDGYIDTSEATALPKLVEVFSKADTNADGKLSSKEFAAVAEQLK